MYQPRRAARSHFIPIRHHRYHVQQWGELTAGEVPVVLLHGWMDVAASWQFVVDAFEQDRPVIAPDWRGFGLTEGPAADSFWFPDYLADLDFLLDALVPHGPVDLVGHSMGGMVAMLYGGARPERIRRLVNLEGFGLAETRPSQAPGRYARWMDELKALHRGDMELKPYDSADGVAERLSRTNPRLSADKAQWLARQWARPGDDGRWRILGQAAHKVISAQLFRVDETLESYRRIQAPVLWVQSAEDSLKGWWRDQFTQAEFQQRLRAVPNARQAVVDGCGHMLHHDQPTRVAQLIETFFTDQQ
ncbi:alpha/beta hydrolase [Ramlibacter sp. AW1]|uniref:Alpha/beta hydrolase n=1 Tax=Ramlibacter aurantiacus TaxID=2801330 RepID=A0A936ZSC5_9BURK|nr:alpha/beta hydrolase [Ramlibacter aurantiacus]MBL0420225.1 alpha/beta hydrolase [Ramlibacter aurantiacus]